MFLMGEGVLLEVFVEEGVRVFRENMLKDKIEVSIVDLVVRYEYRIEENFSFRGGRCVFFVYFEKVI